MGGRSRRRDATRNLTDELLASNRWLQIRMDAVGCMVGQLLREPSPIPSGQQKHNHHHHNANHHAEEHGPIHHNDNHHEDQIDEKTHFDIGKEDVEEEVERWEDINELYAFHGIS